MDDLWGDGQDEGKELAREWDARHSQFFNVSAPHSPPGDLRCCDGVRAALMHALPLAMHGEMAVAAATHIVHHPVSASTIPAILHCKPWKREHQQRACVTSPSKRRRRAAPAATRARAPRLGRREPFPRQAGRLDQTHAWRQPALRLCILPHATLIPPPRHRSLATERALMQARRRFCSRGSTQVRAAAAPAPRPPRLDHQTFDRFVRPAAGRCG